MPEVNAKQSPIGKIGAQLRDDHLNTRKLLLELTQRLEPVLAKDPKGVPVGLPDMTKVPYDQPIDAEASELERALHELRGSTLILNSDINDLLRRLRV